MKKIKLFVNNNPQAQEVASIVTKKLQQENFKIVETDYELAIAIGGDGSFLRMVKAANFNENCLFVGINAGTLGFAQEVSLEDIDEFIEDLKTQDYKVERIGAQEIEITTNDSVSKHLSLNEIVIRDIDLNTVNLSIQIENQLLEKFVGDGMLISTSFGSTAYNLSFGGSIVYNTFHTLQLTPIAPLNNKSYRNLLNSVIIPDDKVITLFPINRSKDLLITIDGDNNKYKDVKKIETTQTRTIQVLRMKDYNFIKKINDKFLK